MASERQIEANRRNARLSTGPRSASGKKRSSKNALRHGLSRPLFGAEFMRELEALARQIVGERMGEQLVMELARAAAEAELDLARIRQVKIGLIERLAALGVLDAQEILGSPANQVARIKRRLLDATVEMECPVDRLPSMPAGKLERTVEAVRRALPELARLVRYETQAAARRDSATRALMTREQRVLLVQFAVPPSESSPTLPPKILHPGSS
jgi:hypothetical protein